jgi:hypothetical protein
MSRFSFSDLASLSVNEAWEELHHAITEYAIECIPEIKFNPNAVRRPKWISEDIRRKIKTKNNAYRTSRITKHGDKRAYTSNYVSFETKFVGKRGRPEAPTRQL